MSAEDYLVARRGATTIKGMVERAKAKGLKSIIIVSRNGKAMEKRTIRISGSGYRWA